MIPLRRLLIVEAHDELPYPEGTACAEVLRATDGAQAAAASAWIFRGMAVGAAVKLLISLALPLPGRAAAPRCPVLPKAELALEIAPALLGVGYILGYRPVAVCVAGALISARDAHAAHRLARLRRSSAPLYPETVELVVADGAPGDIWSRYVRYIGAGAVATAGHPHRAARTCRRWRARSLAVARGHARRTRRRARRPARAPTATCPAWFVFGGVALVVLVAAASCPGVFAGEHGAAAARGARGRRRASSACCSSRWRRASSASSASRRSRPRASRS